MAASVAVLAATDSKEFHRTVPLNPTGQFTIDTYKGSIAVTTWDRNDVDIVASIEPDTGWWFPRSVKDAEVRVTEASGDVRVKSYTGRSDISFFGGSLPLFHYTIRLPRMAKLRIKDYKSDTQVDGLAADLSVDTYKGTVRVRDLSGALSLKTYKGEAHIQFVAFRAESSVDTYKGEVELRMPRNSRFDLRKQLGDRVDLDSDFRKVGAAAEKDDQAPALRLKSHKGSLRLVAQ